MRDNDKCLCDVRSCSRSNLGRGPNGKNDVLGGDRCWRECECECWCCELEGENEEVRCRDASRHIRQMSRCVPKTANTAMLTVRVSFMNYKL